MVASPRKIRRRHAPDELSVQQIRDPVALAVMLRKAGLPTPVDFSTDAQCFLLAYLGDDPVGVAGVETEVDAALMRPLFVLETARRRGIGAALVKAARAAAHARGARTLYATAPADASYFVRLGFAETGFGTLAEAFAPVSKFHRRSDDVRQCRVVCLDISRDGLIER